MHGAHPRSRGENAGRRAGRFARSRLIPAHAGKTPVRGGLPCTPRAHPRSRGENTRYWCVTSRRGGSSPLTRGKHTQASQRRAYPGLIPAHAGKTQPTKPPGGIRTGSSPLTRGKPGHVRCGRSRTGLIPAHAGKTPYRPAPRPYPRAHPRSRGENCRGISAVVIVCGSSPLTRGKHRIDPHLGLIPGLIPAHAGKTIAVNASVVVAGAHPRSRGENVPLALDHPNLMGSSPLTRGKQVVELEGECHRGLIPAHAGKT